MTLPPRANATGVVCARGRNLRQTQPRRDLRACSARYFAHRFFAAREIASRPSELSRCALALRRGALRDGVLPSFPMPSSSRIRDWIAPSCFCSDCSSCRSARTAACIDFCQDMRVPLSLPLSPVSRVPVLSSAPRVLLPRAATPRPATRDLLPETCSPRPAPRDAPRGDARSRGRPDISRRSRACGPEIGHDGSRGWVLAAGRARGPEVWLDDQLRRLAPLPRSDTNKHHNVDDSYLGPCLCLGADTTAIRSLEPNALSSCYTALRERVMRALD